MLSVADGFISHELLKGVRSSVFNNRLQTYADKISENMQEYVGERIELFRGARCTAESNIPAASLNKILDKIERTKFLWGLIARIEEFEKKFKCSKIENVICVELSGNDLTEIVNKLQSKFNKELNIGFSKKSIENLESGSGANHDEEHFNRLLKYGISVLFYYDKNKLNKLIDYFFKFSEESISNVKKQQLRNRNNDIISNDSLSCWKIYEHIKKVKDEVEREFFGTGVDVESYSEENALQEEKENLESFFSSIIKGWLDDYPRKKLINDLINLDSLLFDVYEDFCFGTENRHVDSYQQAFFRNMVLLRLFHCIKKEAHSINSEKHISAVQEFTSCITSKLGCGLYISQNSTVNVPSILHGKFVFLGENAFIATKSYIRSDVIMLGASDVEIGMFHEFYDSKIKGDNRA